MGDRLEYQHPSEEEISAARWGRLERLTGTKYRAGRTAGQIAQTLRSEIAQARAAGTVTLPRGARITAGVSRRGVPPVIEVRVTDLPTDWVAPDSPGSALADQLVDLLADHNEVVYQTPGLEQPGEIIWRDFVGHVILQDTTASTRERAIHAAGKRFREAQRSATSLEREEARDLLEKSMAQQRQADDLPPGTTQRRSVGTDVHFDITPAPQE